MRKRNITGVKSVFRAVTGGLLLLTGFAASAATIELTPAVVNEPVGTAFDLFLDGVNFDQGTNGSTSAGTSGGGVEISWDSSVIDLQALPAGVNVTFTGDQSFGSDPVLNDPAPSISCSAGILAANCKSVSFGVASFFGDPNANFAIATLSFDALNPGDFTTAVNVSLIDIWADYDGNTDMTPTGVGSEITITSTAVVPVPAAVWLFGSGLLGLVGIARRRAAA